MKEVTIGVYVFDADSGIEYAFTMDTKDFSGKETAIPTQLDSIVKQGRDKFNFLITPPPAK